MGNDLKDPYLLSEVFRSVKRNVPSRDLNVIRERISKHCTTLCFVLANCSTWDCDDRKGIRDTFRDISFHCQDLTISFLFVLGSSLLCTFCCTFARISRGEDALCRLR